MRVRTNPFLRVVPAEDGEALVVTDLVANADYRLPNPGMLELLGRAREWTDRERLETVAVEEFGLSPDRAASILDAMVDNEFLVGPDSTPAALGRELAAWRADGWGPAFEYLVCVHDYPYYRSHDYESAMSRVADRAARGGVPPVYKRYDDRERVTLPPVEEAEPLPTVGSVLDGVVESRADLDDATLSALLFYAFGETGRQELPGVGEFLLKTSPSGGGRHPVEAYVAVLDVAGLDAGLYHYAVEDHALERLGGADAATTLLDATAEPTATDPAAAVACTAVVERNMWKYRDPGAYRIPYYDFGHQVETLRLCAAAHGVGVRLGNTLDAGRAAELFATDPLAEPPLGYAVLETDDRR